MHQAAPDWPPGGWTGITLNAAIFTLAAIFKWWATDVMRFWKEHDFSMPMGGSCLGIMFAGRIFGTYARNGRPWLGAVAFPVLGGCGLLSGYSYSYFVTHLPLRGVLSPIVGGGISGLLFGFVVAGVNRLYLGRTYNRADTESCQPHSADMGDAETNQPGHDAGTALTSSKSTVSFKLKSLPPSRTSKEFERTTSLIAPGLREHHTKLRGLPSGPGFCRLKILPGSCSRVAETRPLPAGCVPRSAVNPRQKRTSVVGGFRDE